MIFWKLAKTNPLHLFCASAANLALLLRKTLNFGLNSRHFEANLQRLSRRSTMLNIEIKRLPIGTYAHMTPYDFGPWMHRTAIFARPSNSDGFSTIRDKIPHKVLTFKNDSTQSKTWIVNPLVPSYYSTYNSSFTSSLCDPFACNLGVIGHLQTQYMYFQLYFQRGAASPTERPHANFHLVVR